MRCPCTLGEHPPKLVVLTGGPGAGKTAVLEMARQQLCEHVVVLPESTSLVFGGGFPRRATLPARRAGQRAIYRIQRELERMTAEEGTASIILCDRGTIDGAAYWPLDATTTLWSEVGTTLADQMRRYDAVIHLRVPHANGGYGHTNPLRIETAREAEAIDTRIMNAWHGHPRRYFVESTSDFVEKATRALALIRAEIPACCRGRDSQAPLRTSASSAAEDPR